MTQFKLYAKLLGGHVWVAFFVRTLPTETWAKCGDICMTEAEWEVFRRGDAKLYQEIVYAGAED